MSVSIQNAQNADEISTEEAIINVMSECGLTMFLKVGREL